MRYIWDQARFYLGVLTIPLWPVISLLRVWDRSGARRVDLFVTISRFVAARVRRFYGRRAEVVYPPVNTAWLRPGRGTGQAFLLAGALVPYKRPDLAVQAFNNLGQDLWVVGSGPLEKKLRAMAGPNIKFFGSLPDSELAGFYAKCRALVFPGTEDFGMVPIECLAAGRPVIGLHGGALRETIKGVSPWKIKQNSDRADQSFRSYGIDGSALSGVFIEQTGADKEIEALQTGVRFFIAHEDEFDSAACIKQAQKFSVERFFESWVAVLVRNGLGHFAPLRESMQQAQAV